MGYVFSTGTLAYDGTIVGTLQDVSLDQSSTLVPLTGNLKAPLANALGPGKMSGTCKFTSFDPSFLGTITNEAMAPAAAEVAMVWYLTDTAGVVKSITMPNVTITSLKLAAGADKWLECSLGFEAACTGGTGALATVATEVTGVPALTASTGLWAFSTGSLVLQTHTVGMMSDISLDISWATVPLNSNYRYPVAVAQGPIKISGTTKFSALDANFVETITNSVMAAPASELTAVWTFTDTAAGSHTITLPNVTISGWKLAGGSDKWLQTDVSFEAAAAAADSNILEVT